MVSGKGARRKGQLRTSFYEKFVSDPESGCWVWTAGLSCGYGSIGIPGEYRTMGSHRVSWLLHRGEIPKGTCILHKCDNRLCVNPEHLYVGTRRDNARDALERHPRFTNKRTLCSKGHKLSGDNLYINPRPRRPLGSGERVCRTCQREYMKEWKKKNAYGQRR